MAAIRQIAWMSQFSSALGGIIAHRLYAAKKFTTGALQRSSEVIRSATQREEAPAHTNGFSYAGSTDSAEIACFVGAIATGIDFAKGSRFASYGGSEDITAGRRWET